MTRSGAASESPHGRLPISLKKMERNPRHPGPMIAADYLDPIGLDPADFARFCELDAAHLSAVLRGEASLGVTEGMRVARALDLNPERLVQMQVAFDLAAARTEAGDPGILPAPSTAFPDAPILHGTLAETSDAGSEGYCWFFRENVPGGRGYDGLHALWRGDRLRVYEPDGRVLYVGTILTDLDGRMLLPFARFTTWSAWFFERYVADLAIGDEHRHFLDQLAAHEA